MKERVITGVIGGALFVSCVLIGGLVFKLFILLLAIVAMGELLKMNKIPPFSLFGLISLLLVVLITIPLEWHERLFLLPKAEAFILVTVLLLILTVASKNKYTFVQAGSVLLSSLYVGYGFHLFASARDLDAGMALAFFILFLIWATDSGAYFVGRSFGKRKLWPEISPKKTIGGAIGGFMSALIVGTCFYFIFPAIYPSYQVALVVIILVSIFGQVGDLVQSALKRHYGVKDSGRILPGHGGILDRFDSLIFVMLILHIFQFI